MDRELVVSRYNEPLDWIQDIRDFDGHITVYNKGNPLPAPPDNPDHPDAPITTIRRILNVGREGETYLHHIIKQYNSLADITWFVQADPFHHNKNFHALLARTSDYEHQPFTGLSTHYCRTANVPHQHNVNINNAYDTRHHQTIEYLIHASSLQVVGHSEFIDRPLMSVPQRFQRRYNTPHTIPYVCHLVGLPLPPRHVPFTYSACFAVHKRSIHRHPKVMYQKMRDVLLKSNHQGAFQGYVLERMWSYIFTGRGYNTVQEYWLSVFYRRIEPRHRHVGLFCKSKKRLVIVRLRHTDHIHSCPKTVCLFQLDSNDFVRRLPGVTFDAPSTCVVHAVRCSSLAVACKRFQRHTDAVHLEHQRQRQTRECVCMFDEERHTRRLLRAEALHREHVERTNQAKEQRHRLEEQRHMLEEHLCGLLYPQCAAQVHKSRAVRQRQEILCIRAEEHSRRIQERMRLAEQRERWWMHTEDLLQQQVLSLLKREAHERQRMYEEQLRSERAHAFVVWEHMQQTREQARMHAEWHHQQVFLRAEREERKREYEERRWMHNAYAEKRCYDCQWNAEQRREHHERLSMAQEHKHVMYWTRTRMHRQCRHCLRVLLENRAMASEEQRTRVHDQERTRHRHVERLGAVVERQRMRVEERQQRALEQHAMHQATLREAHARRQRECQRMQWEEQHMIAYITGTRHRAQEQRVWVRRREASERHAMHREHQQQIQHVWQTECRRCSSTLVVVVQGDSPFHPQAAASHLRLFRALHCTNHTTMDVHLFTRGTDTPQHLYPLGKTAYIRRCQVHPTSFPHTPFERARRLWPYVCSQHDHVLLFQHSVCLTSAFIDAFAASPTHILVPFIHTELETTQPYIRTKKGTATLCDRFMYLPRVLAVQTRHVFPLQRTILDKVPTLPFDTLVKTYHHSDSAVDFNPLYWHVDRWRARMWRFVGYGHHVVKGGMFPVIQQA